MNYPVWYIPEIGGGLLIALIAVLHVFVSHFAVGGGLYLIYAEKKGLREGSQAILDFTRRHARFFLLITMVFGSITGVGIWFIIALVNPAGTSYLIHNFVFGWAAEWVFFLVEIAAAFAFYYLFGKMAWRDHIQVGWLYFICAWMSLFLINGIICAMLTPGEWAETGNFWQGFFNPSFWPSLAFRTVISLLLAGSYGFLSAAWTKELEVHHTMTRFSAVWSLAALIVLIPCGLWYVAVLPEQAHQLVLGKSPTIVAALGWGVAGGVAFVIGILFAGIVWPVLNNRLVAVLTMICALLLMGSFEWIREAARRPYVINEVIYSNMIYKKDVPSLHEQGFLPSSLWVKNKTITEENRMAAGKELFIQQCYACHTLGGFNNDIVELTSKMSYNALSKYIAKIHKVRYFMPPFVGTEEEAKALAAFIAGDLHGKDVVEPQAAAGDPMLAGVALFEEHCAACHEAADITGAFEDVAVSDAEETLATLDEISEEMEPFAGSEQERQLLASWLGAMASGVPLQKKISGEPVFEEYCAACHGREDIAEPFAGLGAQEGREILATLDEISEDMEPFAGSEAEADALLEYLQQNQGGE